MTTLIEGSLEFVFPDNWAALKFDDNLWVRTKFGHYQAMDIVATHNDYHWWIEIKDCEGHELINAPRLSPTLLPELKETTDWLKNKSYEKIVRVSRRKPFIIDEVVEKMRDTLVSLSIAKKVGESSLSQFSQWSSSPQTLIIVLMLTWNITDFRRFARLLQQKLNMSLNSYGFTGFVINQNINDSGISCTINRLP